MFTIDCVMKKISITFAAKQVVINTSKLLYIKKIINNVVVRH
jgi:hypothetical protein